MNETIVKTENDFCVNSVTEKCVICNIDTNVPISKHIDYRDFYIEGAGQLCKTCYEKRA